MSTLSPKEKKFYLIAIVTVIIMFGFGYLPTFGQVTPDGMRVLGLFLGCIFAWLFSELVWSSILGMVLLTLFGYGTMTENYASAFANGTVQIMVTSIVFCYTIEKSGLLTEVSRWIVGQKWAQKSPWFIIFVFFLASAVAAMMTGNMIPVMVILWALFYELANEIGVRAHDPFALIVLCGIGVAACMGTSTMPYTGMPSLVRGMAEASTPGFMYNTAEYILMNLLLNLIFLILIVVVLRVLFGSKIKHVEIPKKDSYKMNLNTQSKIALVFLILLILSLIIPNFLPADNALRVMVNNQLTVPGIFMMFSAILMIIHVKEKPVLDISTALSNVPWPLFLLVSTALCISDYLTADGMGVVPTIVSCLSPLVAGKSAFVVTLMFVAFGLVLTNFINDMVSIMVLFPIAAQFILDAGGSIMLLAILFGQACVQGCFMPSGSIIGAMLHGNTEWMTSKEVFKYVGIMEIVVLISLVILTLIGGAIGIK